MTETRIGRVGEPSARGFAPAIRPAWFAGNAEQRLARGLGITQFGVNQVTLAPGAYSAHRHWHEREDEFVYILSGELVLIDGNGEHRLDEGMYAAFPAGAVNAHHLTNRSPAPASFLSVGTRHRGQEVIHYPDDALKQATILRDAQGDRV